MVLYFVFTIMCCLTRDYVTARRGMGPVSCPEVPCQIVLFFVLVFVFKIQQVDFPGEAEVGLELADAVYTRV